MYNLKSPWMITTEVDLREQFDVLSDAQDSKCSVNSWLVKPLCGPNIADTA